MDISSILPLLLQKNGGNNNQTAMLAQALSAMGKTGAAGESGQSANLASVLSAMSGQNAGQGAGQNPGTGGVNPADLLSMLSGGSQNPNLNLAGLLSALGYSRGKTKRPMGLKPVKAFVPDEILGKMVKYFNK